MQDRTNPTFNSAINSAITSTRKTKLHAMDVVTISVRCPKCAVKFNSRQLAGNPETNNRDSELRAQYGDTTQTVESFAICTCPRCGKSDWVQTFPLADEAAVLDQPNMTPHLQFRAAALDAEKNGAEFYNIGTFYLYAAWCADDIAAQPQAREYRKLAAESFSKALLNISLPAEEQATVAYLIGELFRRSGDFERCRQHYNQVIAKLPVNYAYMARKLIKLAALGNMDSIRFEAIG